MIEGISYVKSFRTDFGAEIQQKGLDEVIARLEKENSVRANGAGRYQQLKEPRYGGPPLSRYSPDERSRVVGLAGLRHGECAVAGGQRRDRATGRAAVIDLAGVTDSDSSGLALLIEWLSVAKAAQRTLQYENMPSQLHQLARLSEVEELLAAG